MKPTVGRIVHVNLPTHWQPNGVTVAPAIITRVWGDREGKRYPFINLTIFGDMATADRKAGSVEHVDDAEPNPHNFTWFWPPRE
jgi:hypothetical protein